MLKKLVSPEIIPTLDIVMLYRNKGNLGLVYRLQSQDRVLEIPDGMKVLDKARDNGKQPFTLLPFAKGEWWEKQVGVATEKLGFIEVILEGQEEAAVNLFLNEQAWRRRETGVLSLEDYLTLKDREAKEEIAQLIAKERELRSAGQGIRYRLKRLTKRRRHDAHKTQVACKIIDSPSAFGMPEGVKEVYEELPLHTRLNSCAQTAEEWSSREVRHPEFTRCDIIAYYSPSNIWVIEVKTGMDSRAYQEDEITARRQLRTQVYFLQHNFIKVEPRMLFVHRSFRRDFSHKEVKPSKTWE